MCTKCGLSFQKYFVYDFSVHTLSQQLGKASLSERTLLLKIMKEILIKSIIWYKDYKLKLNRVEIKGLYKWEL